MLNVLDSTKDAYYNHSDKHIEIVFPNRNLTFTEHHIVNKSSKLTECIENGRELTFKGCNSNIYEFKCEDILMDLRDEYLEAYVTANNTERIPLFKGYVADQTNQTHEDLVAGFTCYDEIWKKRNKDVTSWLLGLTYPIKVLNFRNSFFQYIGITQVVDPNLDGNTDLINDDEYLKAPETTTKVVNAIDIMQGICQINGRYGQMGRDGNFHYRYMKEIMKGTYPSSTTFPSSGYTDPITGEYYPPLYPSGENANFKVDLDSYIKLTYEPYEVTKIDKVNILNSKGAVVGSYGNGTNVLTAKDNIVAQMLNDPQNAAKNIYMEVSKLYYVPMQESAIGLPFAECGDIILTRTRKHIVRGYVLKRVLTGEQSMYDSFICQGNQYREKYRESDQTGISSNRTGVKEAKDDILRVDGIVATKASIQQLNAVDAKIDNLTAIAITTQNLSAQNISATQITSGTISANRIASNSITVDKLNTSSLASWQLQCQGLSCTTLYVGGARYSAKSVTIDGQGYTFLGQ